MKGLYLRLDGSRSVAKTKIWMCSHTEVLTATTWTEAEMENTHAQKVPFAAFVCAIYH